ncbi:SDR family NAD(P)-dependent oxidoreductase [Lutimaribacter pacificus]|uniref:SDR family NAD(P)-dependent oxidoreductase n=1 Tax=Lutimaribacter pacificus TaxID=391948 RepID=UPI00122C8ED8|nr:SDR family oxidoreductase [Lutimaribacter pacificus]
MPKIALVTGGTYGIGRAISLSLDADCNVAAVWRSSEPQDFPSSIHSIQADLTQPGQCEAVVADVIDTFGALDIIVNNAGFADATPKDKFDADIQNAILNTNLLVPSALLSAAMPHLKPGASIINISSVNAVLPPNGASIFGASKAALNLWTRAMAKELGASGIRVNAIAPGAINIPENPRSPELIDLFVTDTALGRIGTPNDVAKAVAFLASDGAEFITGQILEVSGGYRL